eukprot:CAMPEP_0181303502 /NCGR_PEP_ID=MMETSP1101-20121128/8596_1 /TAXON_ID=46948 /ORGANISM="Rhodomonas abbreviata, Strain Caron Lab Isolate" /LENGTH=75 /DNA_ID=CAMNT_0023409087 /DNA_START=301 /DNA_END=528 /DNA_ORIENTATION=-
MSWALVASGTGFAELVSQRDSFSAVPILQPSMTGASEPIVTAAMSWAWVASGTGFAELMVKSDTVIEHDAALNEG